MRRGSVLYECGFCCLNPTHSSGERSLEMERQLLWEDKVKESDSKYNMPPAGIWAGVVLVFLIGILLGFLLGRRTGTERKAETASAEKSVESAADAAGESKASSTAVTPEPVTTVSPTPEVIETPAPTAAPAETPELQRDITALPPGYVFAEGEFDFEAVDSYFVSREIVPGDGIFERINGKSYYENDNVALSDLRYLMVPHYNFEGKIQVGEIIVNTRLAEEFIEIFKEFFGIQYQIRSMYLVDNYWQPNGDPDAADTASINEDNTSAFSYRVVTNGTSLSRHAFGCAIDLNPLENPYATIGGDGSYYTIHEESEQYLYNRTTEMPHVITHEDPAYQIFVIEHGFTWGGDWENPVDYQHFEKMVQ